VTYVPRVMGQINTGTMARRNGRNFQASSIASIAISTTVRRIRTNRGANGRDAYSGFKFPGHAQRSLAAYGPIAQPLYPRCHLRPAFEARQEIAQSFQIRQEVMGAAMTA
jgi:hypothetical protein